MKNEEARNCLFGGIYGFWRWSAAIDEEARRSGFADLLPVHIPVFAVAGAVLGTLDAGVSWTLGSFGG